MRTSVTLSDTDLATLITSADAGVRSAAESARDRLAAPDRWPSVAPHVAALIADVLTEARKEGRLIYRGVSASLCRYCGARSEWKVPPRKRKEREYPVSSVDFAERLIVITGNVCVGACRKCVDEALPVLRAELAAFPVQLPTALQTDNAPRFKRWDRCRCKKCEWSGHEGQLGRLRTLMNDGDYPGKCPSCGAERRPLGANPFELLPGFDVVEECAA